MKSKTLFFVLALVFVCVSCTTNKRFNNIQCHQGIINNGILPAIIINDSTFYFCSSHYSDLSYRHKIFPIRKICTCEQMDSTLINIALTLRVRESVLPSTQCVCFYDSSFVSHYILPLFEKEYERKEIEYTLANATDSTFDHIIDFESKVVINEDAWYYPVKSTRFVLAMVSDFKWLSSIIPQEKWIYCHECYCEKVVKYILIPLLEMNTE